MSSRFIHLHTHSHYSLLNALPKIPDLIEAAKKYDMSALALTDNGNLYGAIEFYKDCKKRGIKPIIGIDAYVSVRTRFDKQAGIDNSRTRLVLLAKDLSGYKNLIKLVTASHLEGFYYKPRIDKELIEKHREGLIAILPSFSGDVAIHVKNKNKEKAIEQIGWHKKIFGLDNFFLEISHHPEIEGHSQKMSDLVECARETDSQIVAAHDVYYLNKADKKARDTLVSIQNGSDWSDPAASEENGDFSFISSDQALKYFKKLPEALANTLKIAEMCNLNLPLGKWVFPIYKLPNGLSYNEAFTKLVYEGLKRRNLEQTEEVKNRMEYELKVITDKGYSPYFLVVSDLLRHAHEHNILTTIRGSVAGSLVSYLAGITNVNPLEYELPFERFLNPERPLPPDIDMDYADNRRDEMIEYAKRKYGHDKVAQIGTFGTMAARGSVRDVTRALEHPYSLGDRIARLIPLGAQGFPMTIDRAMEEVAELRKIYKEEKGVKEIIDLAKKIEGCARHISVHAAGVVISPIPLNEFVPLQYDPKGEKKIITQYDMHSIEEAGLLKFDFLGIKNLSILADAVSLAKKLDGVEIDIENIPLDDKKTFYMLAKGETVGLFQLNGGGITRFLKELKPTSILDINAMVALYRPGPMESIPNYIERKHNPKLITYLDPKMKDILRQSYGVITYQDDVMLIATELAGYSWLEADKLRKAMGKKIPAEMEAQKEKLQEGLIKNGMDKGRAEKLWKLIEPFAAYGFNKCVSGDTIIIDSKNGEPITVRELYKSNKQISVHSLKKNLELTNASITTVMENGKKLVFLLKTKSGREIKATDNHPFYTIDGWKDLGNISDGERIAVPRIIRISNENKNLDDYKIATLGYLISEGNLCHPHGVYFYSKSEDEIKDFTSYAMMFKNSKISLNRSKSAISVYIGQKNQIEGNELMRWIKEIGLNGKKATQKFVPAYLFSLSNEQLALFIGKLWQGDGTVCLFGQQLFYATSSKRLANDLQHLLLRFSILSTIHTKKFNYRGSYKIGYTVCITHRENISRFVSQINPYLIGEKQNKINELGKLSLEKSILLGKYPARGTKDIVPVQILSLVRKIINEKELTIQNVSTLSGLSERLFMFDSKKIGYQRDVIFAIAESLNSPELLSYAESDVYWDEVISITAVGEEMTYDLTVPIYHNFVANDIIVHNSHAASYGKVAYQTAYMKANFPAIYMSAVLTADSGDVEKIAEIIAECKRMEIPVLPPNINESFGGFTVVRGDGNEKIRFGLYTIKNFGEGIGDSIINERKQNGKFKSLADFLDRIKDKNLNKKSLEALIKSGAMDELGERGSMLANLENILSYNKDKNKLPDSQDSLFGLMTDKSTIPSLKLDDAPPASQTDKLMWERELLGLYISGHPLDRLKDKFEKKDTTIKKIKEEMPVGTTAVVGGLIEEVKEINTKSGDVMVFLKISDFSGTIEAVVFPRVFQEYKDILKAEFCVAIKGKTSNRNGVTSLIAEKVRAL